MKPEEDRRQEDCPGPRETEQPADLITSLLHLHPFAFVMDATGRLSRLGAFFQNRYPTLLGRHAADIFQLSASPADNLDRWRQRLARLAPGLPSERIDFALAASGTADDNAGLPPLRLAGSLLETDDRAAILFIGTIAPACVKRLSDYGLSIGDFGNADPTPEFAVMAEVNAGMLADSQLINQQLKAAHDQSVAAKQELERQNRFLNTIMEFLPVSVTIRDAATRRFLLVNRAIDDRLAPEDCVGKTFFDLHPQAKAEELKALDDQALAHPNETTADAFFIDRPDGRRLIHQRLRAVPGPGGDPEFILTQLEDVTERWKTLEDLRSSEASLKRSQSMAGIGSWRYHFTSKAIEWSDQMYALWGSAPGAFDLTRGSVLAVIDDQDRPKVIRAIIDTLRKRAPVEVIFRLNAKTGPQIHLLLDVEVEFDENGRLSGLFGTCQDITDRIKAEEQIKQLACQDALTGLPNRFLFSDRLEIALTRAQREGTSLAVHCLDLNDFKGVNDTLGHAVGDELLRQVAQRLRDMLRASDTVARLGGDEFAIVQAPIRSVEEAKQLATRLIDTLGTPYHINDHNILASASVGITVSPENGRRSEQLLRFADTALYQAKAFGRGSYRFFSSEMEQRLRHRKRLERDLQDALDGNQLSVHFQPQYSLRSGRLLGAEALVRWQHPELGWIPPEDFVPIAEEIGEILAVGRYVLRKACREARKWIDIGNPNLKVAVNLSPAQFAYQNLLDTVHAALRDADLPARSLELEITETMLMRDRDATIATLRDLSDLGISLALDDFGTGYSSLSYLRRFQIDKIKIDRSFIADVPCSRHGMTLVQTILSLGHSLGLKVTAEGIENQAQYDLLAKLGCDEAQGYFMSRPISSEAFFALVEADTVTKLPGRKASISG